MKKLDQEYLDSKEREEPPKKKKLKGNKKNSSKYTAFNTFLKKRKREGEVPTNNERVKRTKLEIDNKSCLKTRNPKIPEWRKSREKFKRRNSADNLISTENPSENQEKSEINKGDSQEPQKTIEELAAIKEIQIQKDNIEKLQKEWEKEEELREEKQSAEPFEDIIASIDNADKWTAAFTITKVLNKPTRTLADTGTSNSVVSLNWLRYLGLETSIRPTTDMMVDAQKKKIPVAGVVTLPVQFGNKEFNWEMRVAPVLVCPMILGMDVLHKGSVMCAKRLVEIGDERQPITITLGELEQPTIIAATNKVINPYEYGEIKGRVIKDTITEEAEPTQGETYILNAGGVITTNQLVKSTKLKAENAQVSEYVPIRIFNRTRKKMCIRKGTVLATAEAVSPETLSTLTEYTVEKAIQNHQILAAVFSSDIAKGVSAVHTAYTDPLQ